MASTVSVVETILGTDHGDWSYTYVLAEADTPQDPRLGTSWEADRTTWVDIDTLNYEHRLHPGLQTDWPRLLRAVASTWGPDEAPRAALGRRQRCRCAVLELPARSIARRQSGSCSRSPPEEQVRSRVPSLWTPLQLVHHLAYMEQRWFVWGFLAEQVEDPLGDEIDGLWLDPGGARRGRGRGDAPVHGERTSPRVVVDLLDSIAAPRWAVQRGSAVACRGSASTSSRSTHATSGTSTSSSSSPVAPRASERSASGVRRLIGIPNERTKARNGSSPNGSIGGCVAGETWATDRRRPSSPRAATRISYAASARGSSSRSATSGGRRSRSDRALRRAPAQRASGEEQTRSAHDLR